MAKKYFIKTFGCQMNERDSETIAGMLSDMGYEEADRKEDADLVVINTCSVRDNADKRFFGTLGQLKSIKERRPDFLVALCGCMMQQERVRKDIERKYPWVDMVIGTHNIHQFPATLERTVEKNSEEACEREKDTADRFPEKQNHRYKKDHTLMEVYDEAGPIVEGLPQKRLYRHKAFVNIMYGCDNFCTYCIVPYTRGRERSRKPEDILEEIRRLTEDGVKEVTLLGQNVNSYRSGDTDFPGLLRKVHETDLARIRFMTSHPKDVSPELIEVIRGCPKVCDQIHLPVQAGSDRILERMNRKYTAARYKRLAEDIRKAREGVCISTDIIVGFPGETEEDFKATLDLCREVRFDSAFTFIYSPRPGTPAASYGDMIPDEVKHERFNRLVEIINETQRESSMRLLGTDCEVLVDGPSKTDPHVYTGRTSSFKVVDFRWEGQKGLSPRGDEAEDIVGRMVRVRITQCRTFNLWGELL